jgi:Peptidase inhibitor family I36
VTFKQILQRVAVPAAMTAAVVGGSLVTAPSASAAASDCPANMACIFQEVNFQGRMLGDPDGTGNVGDYMNDRTSSIVNNTNNTFCFYADAGHDGALVYVANAHTAVGWVGDWANDRITSYKVCPGAA